MTNEFHTLNGTCTNLVPQGPGYEGITLANQVCTTVGSVPGEIRVQGIRFVELSLGYYYKDIWRVCLMVHCSLEPHSSLYTELRGCVRFRCFVLYLPIWFHRSEHEDHWILNSCTLQARHPD